MGRKAFVTGGTGFIGINLLELLVQKNWDVTVLHRPSSDTRWIRQLPVHFTTGSITDLSSLEKAVPDDTDVIFHLAGDTNLWRGHNDRQRRVNVEGTANMVQIAGKKGVRVFIHTSSTSAWGTMSGKRVTEQLPQEGHASRVNYELTKWEGEQIVLEQAPDSMKVVILNPAAVTGPYDLKNWGRLFFALRDGKLPGTPDGIISVNHVREVAQAHLSAVDKGRDRERYILAGEDCRFSEFVAEIAHASGIESVPKRIPTPLLKFLASVQGVVAALRRTEPSLTPELVKIMTRSNLSFSSQKAIEELNYQIIPMKQSVRETYRWLKSEELL